MKIKTSDVMALSNVFGGLLEKQMNPEVAYKVATNVVLVSEHSEKIKESYKPAAEYEVFQEARKKLLDTYATPQAGGQYSLNPESAAKFREEETALIAEHKEVVDAQEKYDAKFNEMLAEEIDLDLEIIDLEELTSEIEPARMVILLQTGVLKRGSGKRDV